MSAGEVSLAEKVLRLEEGFRQRGLPHAFGGALALAYYATPRATIDIDVNVFAGVERADEVLDLLATLGARPPTDAERLALHRDAQLRVRWGATPVDLFFAYDPLHDRALERRRRVRFGDDAWIHVLGAEDLVLFKALFDRDKDWRDLAELSFAMADALDAADVLAWLERIVGQEDARHQRLAALLRRHG